MKFAADCLLQWFNKKCTSKNLYLDNSQIIIYERAHSIDWGKGTCCICKFPFDINIKGLEAVGTPMSHADFYIRKEHKCLQNIYSEEDLKKPKDLKDFST